MGAGSGCCARWRRQAGAAAAGAAAAREKPGWSPAVQMLLHLVKVASAALSARSCTIRYSARRSSGPRAMSGGSNIGMKFIGTMRHIVDACGWGCRRCRRCRTQTAATAPGTAPTKMPPALLQTSAPTFWMACIRANTTGRQGTTRRTCRRCCSAPLTPVRCLQITCGRRKCRGGAHLPRASKVLLLGAGTEYRCRCWLFSLVHTRAAWFAAFWTDCRQVHACGPPALPAFPCMRPSLARCRRPGQADHHCRQPGRVQGGAGAGAHARRAGLAVGAATRGQQHAHGAEHPAPLARGPCPCGVPCPTLASVPQPDSAPTPLPTMRAPLQQTASSAPWAATPRAAASLTRSLAAQTPTWRRCRGCCRMGGPTARWWRWGRPDWTTNGEEGLREAPRGGEQGRRQAAGLAAAGEPWRCTAPAHARCCPLRKARPPAPQAALLRRRHAAAQL